MTAPRQPDLLASLNGKLTLLVVVPLLALALLSAVAERYISRVGGEAMDQLRASHKESFELSRATRSVRTQMSDYARLLRHFLNTHQRSLSGIPERSSVQALPALREQASTLSTTLTDELQPIKESLEASVRSSGAENRVIELFDKRYNYIVRTARNLPRLLEILAESRHRTNEFLEAGDLDRARAQYAFEEYERERALQSTLERLTKILDGLAVSVENHIAQTAGEVVTRADKATSDAMDLSFWAASIAIAVVALAAVIIIRLAVSNPIGDLTSKMLRLAKGDVAIEIEGKGRRDEIGKMAGTLQIFKEHEEERLKIELDLAAHRDRLEELVDERTEQLERQKVEIEKALDDVQSANRLKSEFLASMSHEIRTPMNGIIGTTELLLESRLSDRQRAQASTVMTSAEALLHLINDILDFSKIESGKFELENQTFDLLSLVEDASELLAPKARHKMLDLMLRYTPGTPRFVVGDPARLRQILLNLIGNAIKFTESGHVQITVKTAVSREGADLLKFSVEDTGIGISKGKQALIFDRFTQADGSMSRCYGGTGLGLAISKELIGLMGGSLKVESEVDQGSMFWFAIPMAHAPSTAEAEASETSILKGLNLLIVDDTEASRSLLAEHLEGDSRTYAAVEDGYMALEALSRAHGEGKPFDVVILDQMMPGMNGFDLARRIRQEPNYAGTLLVMLSSGESFETIPSIDDHGIGAFMIKPTRKSHLLDTLASLQRAKVEGKAIDQFRQLVHGSAAPERLAAQALMGLHVLLVEDNRINRELARQILTKLSCEVTTAEHGQEAVALVTETSFDVILMDCQMPVMDGFEATQLIKTMIAESEIAYVPIVALTANAMKGDRERCLNAGMDAYATKPVRKKDLIELLNRWCVTRENLAARQTAKVLSVPSNRPSAGLATAIPETPVVDQACLDEMRNVMGDQFRVIIEYFLDDATDYLEQVRGGWQAGDSKAIVAAAHPLKSSSRELGMIELSDIAKLIEETARAAERGGSEIATIGPLVDQLDSCFDKARSALLTILKETA